MILRTGNAVGVVLLVWGVAGISSCAPGLDLSNRAIREFISDSARRYVEFLASDELQGRNTPSPGLLRAAEYLAAAFQRWGLQPIGGSYWHYYELVRRDVDRDSLLLRIRQTSAIWEARIPEHAVPHPATAAGRYFQTPVVLIGPGVPDSAAVAQVAQELRGAVVLFVRAASGSREQDTAEREHTASQPLLMAFGRLLRQYGVVGMLLVNYPERQRKLRPQRYPWPALNPAFSRHKPPLQLLTESPEVPVIYSVGSDVLEALFGAEEVFQRRIRAADSLGRTLIEPLPGVSVDIAVAFREVERIRVPNVVGMLSGRTRPQEYVLIGAHYDHVGVMVTPGSPDSIHNGADDNASGTAGLMLIARAFSRIRPGPERTVVFVAFSGEEKGLLGSRAFVRRPPLPLDSCLVMLNMDMIGRNHPDSLSVGVRGEWLLRLIEQENRRLPTPFLIGREAEEFFGRSDHASFAARGVPTAFFFTGLHEDYHKPSDHADKVNPDKVARVALLVARVAWRIAQQGRGGEPSKEHAERP
ncbi:MAG: M28 family peptidase [Candidatus Kapabacteria bacterium]|nr:M28 family peptidase [Candidatus Kapabacteria bacterium]MDW8225651.1 M28 family peptidase [Bacteroidota bacterium]